MFRGLFVFAPANEILVLNELRSANAIMVLNALRLVNEIRVIFSIQACQTYKGTSLHLGCPMRLW